MNSEDNRFLLGVGLAILGLIPPAIEFTQRNIQLGVLYGLIFLLMVAWFFYAMRSGQGPHYETVRMRKVLTILDGEGRRAEVKREQTIRARYGSLEGIWWRGNIVDGTMSDFKVDNSAPQTVERLGCMLSFYKKFPNPLAKGDEITVIWSFIASDSVAKPYDEFLHEIIPGTKELEMEINFPSGHPCSQGNFYVEVAGYDTQPVPGLVRTRDGMRLSAPVKRPKAGRTYKITWNW